MQKGTVVIRIEDTVGVSVIGNIISGVVNLSFKPFEQCSSFHAGTSRENLGLQQMGDVRGISLAAVRGFARNGNQLDRKSQVDSTESSSDEDSEFRQSIVKNNVIGKLLGGGFV